MGSRKLEVMMRSIHRTIKGCMGSGWKTAYLPSCQTFFARQIKVVVQYQFKQLVANTLDSNAFCKTTEICCIVGDGPLRKRLFQGCSLKNPPCPRPMHNSKDIYHTLLSIEDINDFLLEQSNDAEIPAQVIISTLVLLRSSNDTFLVRSRPSLPFSRFVRRTQSELDQIAGRPFRRLCSHRTRIQTTYQEACRAQRRKRRARERGQLQL